MHTHTEDTESAGRITSALKFWIEPTCSANAQTHEASYHMKATLLNLTILLVTEIMAACSPFTSHESIGHLTAACALQS